ncbi:MAG: histidine phosphatase family protein [Tissierellia bacterium]|nr:histidine phosphatase family protein [Tissierellia bacterium]MDD4780828.1 histidine phosphatase family protein [Tissierellia bacterium]
MIYLVRHGESFANINKRFSGITDVELSDLGRKQALQAGQNLREYNISRIFTSPLIRACETAKIIGEQININIEVINNLIEVNFGIFENMTWEEIVENHKEETELWVNQGFKYKFPEGESYDDIINRISSFIDNLEDNSVIVTHFGVIQAILLYLKAANYENVWDYRISNCDIIVLENNKIKDIIKCEI